METVELFFLYRISKACIAHLDGICENITCINRNTSWYSRPCMDWTYSCLTNRTWQNEMSLVALGHKKAVASVLRALSYSFLDHSLWGTPAAMFEDIKTPPIIRVTLVMGFPTLFFSAQLSFPMKSQAWLTPWMHLSEWSWVKGMHLSCSCNADPQKRWGKNCVLA